MRYKGLKFCFLLWGVVLISFIFIRTVRDSSDKNTKLVSIKANQKPIEQSEQKNQWNQQIKPTIKPTTKPKNKIIVAIDAGHGGNDCGAIACDKTTYEKDINLFIALELEKQLKENDITVVMTRKTDQYVALEKRANIVTKANADLLICIHCNSVKDQIASGLTVYYNENQSDNTFNSKQFSTLIGKNLERVVPYKNRGIVKGSHLYIVRSTKAIVALAEIGFISYKKDFDFIKEKTNQTKIAKSLYDGIIKSIPYMEGNKRE